MARNDPQVNFRIPVELKQRLEAEAEKNNRSFKAEIEYRLANWEDLIDQFNLAQENWEAARRSAEFHKEHADALIVEIGLANGRYENLEDHYEGYRHETALELSKLKSEALPKSLLKRIERRASETGRTPQEELTQALEAAFPPPLPTQAAFPFSDLEMLVLQWHSADWHLVDWDTWGRFRSGDTSTEITENRVDGDNYFIVSVFDEEGNLRNIVAHNYLISESGYSSRAFELLSEAEREEYNRLMTASSATKDDETRLRNLQNKMDPAHVLPPNSIPRLREILERVAPGDVVDNLIRARGLLA